MAVVTKWNPDRIVSIHLYLAREGDRAPAALISLRDDLIRHGVEAWLVKRNPVTPGDIGKLVIDALSNHGEAIGAAIVGSLAVWLKQRNGRRVEIERTGLKVKVPSTADLEKALTALHDFDEASFTLTATKAPKTLPRAKPAKAAKTAVAKRARKSK